MKAILYARVSTEEQLDNWSVSAQIREFERYCEDKGWQNGGVYKEEGKSAGPIPSKSEPSSADFLMTAERKPLTL
jgi:DNA invertase Pin-like site-specific DNA recombinase